jgi:hypothetical protein
MKRRNFSTFKLFVFFVATTVLAALTLLGYKWSASPDLPKVSAPLHFSPYLDFNLAVEGGQPLANTHFSGTAKSIINLASNPSLTGLKALSLAFATGECGKEHWGGLNAQALATANLLALQQANLSYTISTGGMSGVFTCDSQAGMDTFIQRYQSSHLLGFDFNIEANQTQEVIQNLVREVGSAMTRYPDLRFSFTLAALAAKDGANSLNQTGQWVMQALSSEGLKRHTINLMVMNYGRAEPGNCVVRVDHCDMAASAIRAVNNLSRHYKLPLARIEVTPMIGINDVTSNVFTIADAQKLRVFARTYGLGGLHYWSLNRDAPCGQTSSSAQATCHGLAENRKLAFIEIFSKPDDLPKL